VLPRHNRIIEPGDFRQVVRRGDKRVTKNLIVYRRPSESNRVGVVVTTKCGNAVVRNLLRRRTKAICRDLILTGNLTGDVVVRFRCEGITPTFDELRHELRQAIVQ
jgi:ribonuclease P protein component